MRVLHLERFFRFLIKCFIILLLISLTFLPLSHFEISSSTFSNLVNPNLDSESNNLAMIYSTYFGRDATEQGKGIALYIDGSYYVTGRTESSDFPTLYGFDNSYNGGGDVYLSKFSSTNELLWSTFFGGSDLENSFDIAIANDGSCYIVGTTESIDFPIKNAYQNNFGGGYEDVFVAKFSTSGLLLWSTYLGGSNGFENGFSIAVTEDGSCYVTGETQSSNFPTKNAYDSDYNGGNFDSFIVKFSSNGWLRWSTFLGGSNNDVGKGIAVTRDGSCYVTGWTGSNDFPTLCGFDTTLNGDWDCFVAKFTSAGKLLWSTYLGGTWWDEALSITIARDDSCYLVGFTQSADFPTKQAYNNTKGLYEDAFVSRFAVNGSLLWSTFLGGNGADRAYDVVAAVDCSCYVIGETFSTDFPTPYAFDDSYNGLFDVFISRFATNGSLLWGTYLGGSEGSDKGYGLAASEDGMFYVIGDTYSDDFPLLDAFDSEKGNARDAFIAAFIDPFPLVPYAIPFLSSDYSSTLYGLFSFFVFAFIVVLIISVRRKRDFNLHLFKKSLLKSYSNSI